MADNTTGLHVKSLDSETVRAKLVDSGGTNEATISAGGRISVDGSGVTQPVSGTIAVSSITTGVIPGVGGTSLGKAEDAGHTTGDTGVMALAVRNDGGTALAATDLDYIPLTTDATGALRVTGGGGTTQYVEDVASAGAETLTLAGAIREDTPSSTTSTDGDFANLKTDSVGRLWVNSSGVTQPVNVLTVPAPLSTTGNGTAATALRVTLASDSTGTTAVTQATAANLNAQVVGTLAHDAVASGNPIQTAAFASAAAPTNVSADGDVVRLWALRSGALATQITAAGTLITGDGANGLDVDVTRVSGTVTVDTELPAAAALADAAANPTTAIAGAANLVFNGTTWDRARGAATLADALANPGVGLAQGQNFLMGYNGTTWDRVRTANTGRLQVDIVTGGGSGTQYVGDAPITATPTGTVAMGLASAAAPTNVSADNDAVAFWALRNGSQVVNLASGGTLITVGQGTMAASLPVTIASNQSALAVSGNTTPLPSAAALADATANPTTGIVGALNEVFNGTTWDRARGATTLADALANPGVGLAQGQNFLMGYNGTTWDRVRTANTGRLQVDVVTGGGANASILVDNAGFTDGTSSVTGIGFIYDEVAGTALSENDIAAARIDLKRAQIGVIEDATTRGQRAAVSSAGALASNITQVAGATPSATNALSIRPTDGSAYLSNLGQTAGTAEFIRITDATNTAAVIATINALKTDLSSVAGAVPSATNPVPVRLTDGSAFYAAASGAPNSPQTSTATSSSLGAGASVDLDHTAITGGTTGQLMGVDVSSAVPLKVEIKTVNSGTPTTRLVIFTQNGDFLQWRAPFKTFITQAGGATSRFRVTVTNRDNQQASDVYSTAFWDQV